jgi:hypothetical protein
VTAAPSSFAPFDPEPIRRCLEELIGKDPDSTYFRTIRPRSGANKARKGADLLGFDPAALLADNRAGQNVYMVVGRATAASGVNKETGKPTGAVIDDDVADCPCLFVEWDDRPEAEQLRAWEELGLPEPTAMIDSGGKSVHVYWRMVEPITPAQWTEATARLIAHCGSDSTCSNLSRLMRVPGFAYIDKKTGKPTGGKAEVIYTSGRSYSLQEVMDCLPDPVQQQPAPAAPQRPRLQLVSPPPPRSLEEVNAAAEFIPVRVGGKGTYAQDRNALCGCSAALAEAGCTDPDAAALALLGGKWPSHKDADHCLATTTTRNAASFWAIAKAGGYDTRRHDLRGKDDDLAGFEVLEDEVGAKREEKAQGDGGQQQEKTKEPSKPPQQRKSWDERNKRKLTHTRAMRCFDRCVEVQAQQQRNSLTRRARLLKALHDLDLAKYVNRAEISQKVLEAKDRQQGRCFKAITSAERIAMERPTVSWLIPGILPDGDASIIGGRPKVGKTRLAYALAAALLTGKPVFGFEAPAPRPVIVISDDQGDGDTADMLTELGIWDHPGLTWSRNFRLTESDLDLALAEIKRQPGALVIFDSLRSISRSLQYGENDPELGAIIYDLKEAVVEAGGTPVLIHHCNKTEGLVGIEALSGHSAIPGAANTILTVAYLPDEKGKPQKDDQQRRLHREARSGKPFDLVIAPAAGGAFERVAEFGEWVADQRKVGSEQEALGKMPTVNVKILEVLCRDREKWFTRREVCEARGVPWGDRGRGPEVQKVTRALQRLVKENFAESQRNGQEATFRAAGGGGEPHMGHKSDDNNDSDAIQ